MTIDDFRREVDRIIDKVEMASYNKGFEAVLDALDEMSNRYWNEGAVGYAECLRKAVKELKGENVEN
jgi:soluble cytochrome b562